MYSFKSNVSFIYFKVLNKMKTGVSTLNNHMIKVDSKSVNKIVINGFSPYVFLFQRLLILTPEHEKDTQLRLNMFLF